MKATITNFDINRKIYAIKAVRQATGWGLKEAKEAIDNVPTTLDLDFHQIEYLRL